MQPELTPGPDAGPTEQPLQLVGLRNRAEFALHRSHIHACEAAQEAGET